jgi:outer membrane cobalamin receptor
LNRAFLQLQYTALTVQAPAVTQLSKYVLDFAPHTLTATAAIPAFRGVSFAPRVEYKRRSRTTAAVDYVLIDARVSRRFGLYELQVEGTNLLDTSYQEIVGVAMPGRAVTASIRVGR